MEFKNKKLMAFHYYRMILLEIHCHMLYGTELTVITDNKSGKTKR